MEGAEGDRTFGIHVGYAGSARSAKGAEFVEIEYEFNRRHNDKGSDQDRQEEAKESRDEVVRQDPHANSLAEEGSAWRSFEELRI